ncbi:hypothetical protein [uncultured Sunxiuqinia sp.]|nr:hypothetical protein [uncultured Sunxiuqinia sp.]
MKKKRQQKGDAPTPPLDFVVPLAFERTKGITQFELLFQIVTNL